MTHLDRLNDGSVPDMISDVARTVEHTEMSQTEIREALHQAGELVQALARKNPSERGNVVGDGESESAPEVLDVGATVGKLRSRARSNVGARVGHHEFVSSTELHPERSSEITPRDERRVDEESLLPDEFSRVNDDLVGYEGGEYSQRDKAGDPHAFESQKERIDRLIDAATKLLQEEIFDHHFPLLTEEMSVAAKAARAAIEELKYPGGFSVNPLKAVSTLQNFFRFMNGRPTKDVVAAEEKLYPELIKRAVAMLLKKRTGTPSIDADTVAEIQDQMQKMLPRSFQLGSGWRNELKRKLEDALRNAQAERDALFATE